MMPSFITQIGPVSLPTFTFVIALAVLAGAGAAIYRAGERRGAWADAYLLALALGVIGARAGHVLLNWEHFSNSTAEITQVSAGGLDWHGAVIGGLIGVALGARWRRLNSNQLLSSLMLAVPLITLSGWWGCLAANCGFGREVDTLANYPAWIVSEAPDVYGILAPRYNTQFFGLLLGVVALLIALILLWRGWLLYRRFWLLLAFISTGMFVVGFWRADFTLLLWGLRADQVLDLALLLFSLFMTFTRKSYSWQT